MNVYLFSVHIYRVLLLVAVLSMTACNHPKQPSQPAKTTAATDSAAAEASGEYTLRIVFDGLTTFWAPNKSDAPGELWAFMGPRDPARLDIGKKMPPHRTHLLIQHIANQRGSARIEAPGRALSDPKSFNHVKALRGRWREVMLEGEDLTLVADTSTPLQIVRNTRRLPHPCQTGVGDCTEERARREREDFAWTVDLADALEQLPRGTSEEKSIRKCLTETPFRCPDLASQLSARVRFKNGRVTAHKLYEKDGSIGLFTLGETIPGFNSRAQAEEVAVELKVQGEVKFISRPLQGTAKKGNVVINGRPGQIIEVRFANHPVCHPIKQCKDLKFTDNDFLFNFNLLNKPTFNGNEILPTPKQEILPETVKGPSFNGQCSPTSLTR